MANPYCPNCREERLDEVAVKEKVQSTGLENIFASWLECPYCEAVCLLNDSGRPVKVCNLIDMREEVLAVFAKHLRLPDDPIS